MAFMKKIFQPRKNNQGPGTWNSTTQWNKGQPPQLERSQVRLLIYDDSEGSRRLVFDSKAIRKVEDQAKRRCMRKEKTSGSPQLFASDPGMYRPCHRAGPKYEFLKLCPDAKMLEEIMFGSVGMAYKGASIKVHFLRDEMVLTKVFIPVNPKRESQGSDADLDSLSLPIHSDPDLSSPRQIYNSDQIRNTVAQSVPVDVPSPQNVKFDLYDRDSGLASLTSSGSFHHSFPSPGSSTSSCNSYSSLHRRWIRGVSTSIEGCLRKRNSQDNLISQDSGSNLGSGAIRHKQSKLAMGIIFGLCDGEKDTENNQLFQNFFFSHITLFEGHLEKLRIGVERAYYTRKRFLHIVMESLEKFQQDVVDLYTTPRLSEPVWLNMMCLSSYRYQLCENFMKEFMTLVSKLENKNTRFFMSTLVTAVLTHHLAWVPTVTPAGGTPSKTYLTNHSAKWVDMLAKTHPYNPLWAQLGDMYGAIGYPIKVARTVIVGKKADLVKKILYILTYFIRCSDVQNKELGSLESFMEDTSLDSPSEDKPVISPIEEVANQSIVQEVMSSSRISDKMGGSCDTLTGEISGSCKNLDDPSKQDAVISSHPFSYSNQEISQHSSDSDSKCSNRESRTRPKSLSLSKIYSEEERTSKQCSNESKQKETMFCFDSINSDEGYCSIVQSSESEREKSQMPCRLSDCDIRESVKVENVQHVGRATTLRETYSSDNLEISQTPTSSPCKKGKSLLSSKINSDPKLSTSEIRQIFLKEGSHSIFNEYFDDENIEAKTIDEVEESNRVVSHPLVAQRKGHAERMSSSVDNINESSHSLTNLSECQGHERRLGSVGHSVRPRIPSVTRQISQDRGRTPTGVPGRCRPVTPTELSRRRHLSSTGSFDFDNLDPLVYFKEIDMPNIVDENSGSSIKMFDRNFGRSLLAGYSSRYLSDFVLHGTSETANAFIDKMYIDLHMASQHSVLDEPISEAVCVIADTDRWSVEVCKTGNCVPQPVVASKLVCDMLEGVLQLWKLKMSSEFCLMHLEDRLQEIYFKSKMLAEYLKDVKKDKVNMRELKDLLGFENGDVPLLVAIAGTHSPHLSLGIV